MKSKLLFALLIAFVPFLALSQKNDISVGMLYLRSNDGDQVISVNSAYFKNISPNSSIGIIIDFCQYIEKYDDNYKNWYGERDFANFINLIYKNNFYKKGRSSLYYGSGIAFGTIITYYKTIPEFGVCGVGLPPDYKHPKPPNHWNYEYNLGINAMLDYHYRIINSFYVGVNLRGAIIYYFEFDELSPGFIPSIKVGYKW